MIVATISAGSTLSSTRDPKMLFIYNDESQRRTTVVWEWCGWDFFLSMARLLSHSLWLTKSCSHFPSFPSIIGLVVTGSLFIFSFPLHILLFFSLIFPGQSTDLYSLDRMSADVFSITATGFHELKIRGNNLHNFLQLFPSVQKRDKFSSWINAIFFAHPPKALEMR